MAEEVPQNNASLPDDTGGNGQSPVAVSTQNPLPNYNLIGDRYQVLDMLGRGGMGTVLKARHIKLNKLVAIKVLNPAILTDESSRARFELEAKACGKLTHPNLIAVFDYGYTPNDEPYLAMEYVSGVSLDTFIQNEGLLNTDSFVRIFSQLCKPLQFIHKNGIIHRDLKPSNIMLHTIEDEQYVKLLDFGIAKVLPDAGAASQHLTATGMVYGSPIYMSPEQCRGKAVDGRSDIYSLGCVMYQCVAGRPPFEGENILQTLFMHANDLPPPLPPNVNAQAAGIILKCLQKQPADRFQTPGDLLAALTAIERADLAHPQQSAVSLSTVDRSPRPQSTAGGGMMSSRLVHQSRQPGLGPTPNTAPPLVSIPAPPAGGPASGGDIAQPPAANHTPIPNDGTAGGEGTANIRSARFAQIDEPRTESRPKYSARPMQQPPSAQPLQMLPMPALAAAGIVALALASFAAYKYGGPALRHYQLSQAMQQAESAFKSGKWAESQAQLSHAYTLADGDDDEAIGKIRERLGDLKLAQRQDSEAYEDYSVAIKKLEPHKDLNKDAYLDATFGMAQTLHQQGLNKQAETYFAQARSLADDLSSPSKQAEVYCASGQNYKGINLGKALEFYDQGIDAYGKVNPVPQEKLADAWVTSAEAVATQGASPESARRAQQGMLVCAKVTDPTAKSTLETRCSALLQAAGATAIAAPPPAAPATFPQFPTAAPAATVAMPPVDTSNPAVAIEQLKLQQAQVQLEDVKARAAAFNNLNQFITQHNQRLNDAVVPQLQRLNSPATFAQPANNYDSQPPQLQPVHQLYVPQHVEQTAPPPARSAPIAHTAHVAPVRSAPAPAHSHPQRPSSAPQQSADEPFWR